MGLCDWVVEPGGWWLRWLGFSSSISSFFDKLKAMRYRRSEIVFPVVVYRQGRGRIDTRCGLGSDQVSNYVCPLIQSVRISSARIK